MDSRNIRPRCPHCKEREKIIKKGRSKPRIDGKKVRKFQCKNCKKYFSEQTFKYDYYLKIRNINQLIFRLLCKGMSQRAIALALSVSQKLVALRVKRFGEQARKILKRKKDSSKLKSIAFDEMESFEHTKCKPLTIPISVDMKTRKILSISIGKIQAKGHLAEIARKKYGPRKSEKAKAIQNMLQDLKGFVDKNTKFICDESPHYPKKVKQLFPDNKIQTFKGRKACIVGYGELKATGKDPLFNLNHTFAMIRDNIKRLTRRTWCTTKKPERLFDLLNIYVLFHNQIIDKLKPKILTIGDF